MTTFEKLKTLIPKNQLEISGSVFYSGKSSFNTPSNLYILGLNPGGSPEALRESTIQKQISEVDNKLPPEWSAYSDESWQNAAAGTWGLQPRVLHMLNSLNISPRHTPSSNLIFVRTAREAHLGAKLNVYAAQTWPFHQHVIDTHKTKVILCFGKKTGEWVAQRIQANTLVEEFIENNNRRWRSKLMRNNNGQYVVIATHPSIADWRNKATDPTRLVEIGLRQTP
jgi:hypothetical protein